MNEGDEIKRLQSALKDAAIALQKWSDVYRYRAPHHGLLMQQDADNAFASMFKTEKDKVGW